MVTVVAGIQSQCVEALQMVRRYRHQPDCRCGVFQGLWCSGEEQTWQNILDRLIDKAPLMDAVTVAWAARQRPSPAAAEMKHLRRRLA